MADYFFRYFFFLFLFMTGRLGVEGTNDECKITKCGENGSPIRFPFRLKPEQPKHCGYPGFELSCNHMNQTVLELPVALEVVVDEIDYISQIIYVHDPHNCFLAQVPRLNLSASPFNFSTMPDQIALFNCSPAERNSPTLVPCLSGPGYQIYAEYYLSLNDELENCVKIHNISSIPFDLFEYPQSDIQLSWSKPNCSMCESKGKMCRWKNYNTTTAAAGAGERELLECVKMPKKPTALKPSRFSFADIKKITNKFKDNLGEGSYGTVFKGKLSSKIFIAIKVLESSMENGKKFINEVDPSR
ncbi:hypothetical protein LguiB_013253 [Lonicera macranthoides]